MPFQFRSSLPRFIGEHPDESGQLAQPVWFEDEIFPFFPRKWVNCPYFSMKRFVIDLQSYCKQLQTITFHRWDSYC